MSPGWVTVLLRLPVFYNADSAGDHVPVEDGKFLGGFWWDQGVVDKDVLAMIEVDVPDTTESREWLQAYARDVLRGRFQQKVIYLKFVGPVEHLVVGEEELSDEN